METPVRVTFQGLPTSEAVRDACLKEVAKLERYCDRITSCDVVVSVSHRRHRKGNLFEVRIRLRVPGDELVVDRQPGAHQAAEDVYVVIREAFDRARRLLEDHVRRRRGQVKAHQEAPAGRVARLFADEGYGFIATPDGGEVYFHRNALAGDEFDQLEVGTRVSYTEGHGDEGPQAASVRVLRPAGKR